MRREKDSESSLCRIKNLTRLMESIRGAGGSACAWGLGDPEFDSRIE